MLREASVPVVTPIRILIVDDEPRLRASLERYVRSQSDMTVIGTLSNADALCSMVPREASIVLLDLTMPGRDPLDAASQIQRERPECRVILYTGHNDPDTVQLGLACGAWGLVDKLTPPAEILQVIRRVASGETSFPDGSLG